MAGDIKRNGLWAVCSTAMRLFSFLVAFKLVAFYAGPEGLGKMGHFMSLLTILSVLAGGGITNGLIKYVAEHRDDYELYTKFLGAGLFISFLFSILMCVLSLVFCDTISVFLFSSQEYSNIVCVLALCQVSIGFYNFILGVLNGLKQIQKLAIINFFNLIFGLFLLLSLSYFFEFKGALLGIVFMQSTPSLIALIVLKNSDWLKSAFRNIRFNRAIIKKLSAYSAMAALTAVIAPLTHIMIRQEIVDRSSWEFAGYWQSIVRISDVYLLFFTSVLISHFLPTLSRSKDVFDIKKNVFSAYKNYIPPLLAVYFLTYFLKDYIIVIIYSEDFLAASDFIHLQFLSDIVKAHSWILSFIMLAKKMTKLYIFSEIVTSIFLITITKILLNSFGFVGVFYAQIFVNLIYFLFFLFYMLKGYNDAKLIWGISNETK